MVVLVRPHIDPIGVEVIVVKGEQEYDPFGDPIGGTAEDISIPGCHIYPKGADEAAFRAATTTDDLICLAPVWETDVKSTAVIRWRGKDYHVDGNPMPWTYLDGEYAGTQINLVGGGG